MSTELPVGSDAFPFRSEASLAPLIGFWERRAADATAVDRALAQCIVEQLKGPLSCGCLSPISV